MTSVERSDSGPGHPGETTRALADRSSAVTAPRGEAARRSGRSRIVVLGYIIRGPFGGMAWHHMQYVAGLARLGHDVMFIEDSDDYASCYDPERQGWGIDPSYGLRFADDALGRLGLGDRWAYFDAHTGRWLGPGSGNVRDFCASAELLINVSGVNPLRPWLVEIPRRALIDTDPAFTQIRHLTDPSARRMAELHTAFFTFGEAIPGGASD
ncbi:MAG: glycosyltransferase family protein, partial [Isosphaeraceae bacterium]